MNIVILGAGQVGTTLAENLSSEDNNITVVDLDGALLRSLQNRLDIRTVVGNCSHPNILQNAGVEDTDMLIAVTDHDESNMMACQVAYTLFQTPMKIARVRSPHYHEHPELFDNKAIPIDVLISPEKLVTNIVHRLIEYPGALQVLDFAKGKVQLVSIKPYYGGPLVGKTLKLLYEYMPDIETKVAAIYRGNHSIPLDENTVIEIGDEVFFIAASHNILAVMGSLRRLDTPYQRIIIAGGGNIGFCLAQTLENNYQIKIIERNEKRAAFIAEELNETTVLLGDASDRDLLVDENIEYTDVFCAMTNDDEANIMACLQAKRLGVHQAIALITRSAYVDLIEGSDIDIAISPQQTTIGSILTHIRKGDVVQVHSLRRGAAEAIEAVAHGDKKTSKVVARKIGDINLPSGTTIGAIVRDNKTIIPDENFIIESDDHVILFVVDKKHIHKVEKLFQVDVSFI